MKDCCRKWKAAERVWMVEEGVKTPWTLRPKFCPECGELLKREMKDCCMRWKDRGFFNLTGKANVFRFCPECGERFEHFTVPAGTKVEMGPGKVERVPMEYIPAGTKITDSNPDFGFGGKR